MSIVRDNEPWDALLERRARRAPGARAPARGRVRRAAAGTAPRGGRGAGQPRDRLPLAAPAGRVLLRLRAHDDRHHRDGVGQVAVLPAPDAADALDRGVRRGRCTSTPPRRWRRTRRARCTRSTTSGRRSRSTTATRRASTGRSCASARTWCSPTRTCCTSGSSRTTRRGRGSSRAWRSSWSTRRTSTAACSARTWPTCCGGCGGSASTTGPRRGSCSPQRPSPTRASSRRKLTGLDDVHVIYRDGSPGTGADDRDVEPAGDRRRDPGAARRRWARRLSCSSGSSPRARGRSCS